MADEKVKTNLSDQDYLLAEVVVKLTAIERVLIKAGITTTDDLIEEMKKISQEVVTFMSSFNSKAIEQMIATKTEEDKKKN
jgi:predicted RecB family nuclease